MKVFLTGATGYVGSEIAKLLKAEGHTVVGLARSKEKVEKLKAAGLQAMVGSLEQPELLAKAAAEADAVIHTAFVHNGSPYADACRLDLAAVQAMTDALAGTNKPFLLSQGLSAMGNTGPVPVDEEFPFDPELRSNIRIKSSRVALAAAGNGVRSIVLRLPSFVWGNGGPGFIALQISAAKKLGKAVYILPGDQMACGCHVEDVAQAYLLALKHAPAGSTYNICSSNDSTLRSIAEAVGANLGVLVEGKSLQDVMGEEIWPPWIAPIFALNLRVKSDKAQSQLHWCPAKTGLLEYIAGVSYDN